MRPDGTTAESADLAKFGYVVLRNFFDDRQVRLLRTLSDGMTADAAKILAESIESGVNPAARAAARPQELIVVPEASDPRQVCRYEFMYGYSSGLRRLIDELILPRASELLGDDLVIFKDKTNEKSPGGGAFGPHQDFAAYKHFEPRYNLTAMISIDSATLENGCVQFADNYATLPDAVTPYTTEVTEGRALYRTLANGDLVPEVAHHMRWRPVATTPADLVLFDSFVPHYSEANASQASRRAMFITMNRRSEGEHYDAYYRDKRQNYHDPKFHVSTPTWRVETM
ncbi:MAG: phytanoyl-CoA dioxygenase family protein [Hyphomicrobiales bacterium]